MKKYIVIFIGAVVLSFMFVPALMKEDGELQVLDTESFSKDSSLLLKTLNSEAGIGESNEEDKANEGDSNSDKPTFNINSLTEEELNTVNNGGVIIKEVKEINAGSEKDPFTFGNMTNEMSSEGAVLSIGGSGE